MESKMKRELSLDEMDKVTGGSDGPYDFSTYCPKCGMGEIEGSVDFMGMDPTTGLCYYRCKCGFEFSIRV